MSNYPIPPISSKHRRDQSQWDEGGNWDGGYALDVDPAFLNNSNHFSASGRPVLAAKDWIQEVLELYPADMMLVLLGVNDLAFCCSPEDTLDNMATLIKNARKAAPNIEIALGNAVYQSFAPDGTDNIITYNDMLPKAIPGWSTPESPVYPVHVAENYACGNCDCPGGIDGLHPNSWGDYHIAYAFSETLVKSFGIGVCPLVPPPKDDPSLKRYLPIPSNLRVEQNPEGGVTATWDPVWGAYLYKAEISINGGPFETEGRLINQWATWPFYQPGATYSFRVAAYGQNQTGNWTETLSATAKQDDGALFMNGMPPEMPDASLTDPVSQPVDLDIDHKLSKRVPINFCVGGTAPTPKPCKPVARIIPTTRTGRVGRSTTNLGYLVMAGFVAATLWIGRRMFLSRPSRSSWIGGWSKVAG